MAKHKALTNKEILIGYCSTLSDKAAGEVYKIITETLGVGRKNIVKFNADGVEDKQGYVRLRKQDVRAILEHLGEDYFKVACNLMHNYIAYLKEQAPYNQSKHRKYRELLTSSHGLILTKGWVAERIEKDGLLQNTRSLYDNPIDFFNIKTIDDALKFLNAIPSELRLNNPEITYLILKYPDITYDSLNQCWKNK